jgi:shikimate kinase
VADKDPNTCRRKAEIRTHLGTRLIVLTGMMGAGKSSIGKRLAAALDLPFLDADAEIETAAGKSIEDMFREHGEPYFRDGEERVIKRLLGTGPGVLATGGGAVLSERTRAAIAQHGVSVWLKAPVDLLLYRVSKRDNRPLLKASDPRGVLEQLLAKREPLYATANIVFESRDAPHDAVVEEMLVKLHSYLSENATHGQA